MPAVAEVGPHLALLIMRDGYISEPVKTSLFQLQDFGAILDF